MAKTGYGKRSVGDENPDADPNFAHLNPRDAEIAVFIDHLEDGHAMGHKVIAAEHPHYGQQAVRTSAGRLVRAGHLRWIKEHITIEEGSMRWVTRTYWSRTPRSVEWWADFARERDGRDVTEHYQSGLARVEESEPAGDTPTEEPTPAPVDEPSTAYRTLADIRSVDPRMPLSDADCHSLESLVTQWLSRGATPQDVTTALTDGLPSEVANPGGFARKRLEKKMPPTPSMRPKKAKLRQKAARRARVTRVIMACGLCDADELTVEIVHGLCPDCLAEIEADGPMPVYTPVPDTFLPAPRAGDLPGADEVVDVTARVDELRRAGRLGRWK
ncbi:hypothetical protein WB401_28090 [Streptomyces brasiliscabiei]|uniref:MarR family transcriptional regulator n=1 Tax=Streptomyces brasiliscabiei TaxID=2736302 RepID=A0ABU8GPH4_9ACTN